MSFTATFTISSTAAQQHIKSSPKRSGGDAPDRGSSYRTYIGGLGKWQQHFPSDRRPMRHCMSASHPYLLVHTHETPQPFPTPLHTTSFLHRRRLSLDHLSPRPVDHHAHLLVRPKMSFTTEVKDSSPNIHSIHQSHMSSTYWWLRLTSIVGQSWNTNIPEPSVQMRIC